MPDQQSRNNSQALCHGGYVEYLNTSICDSTVASMFDCCSGDHEQALLFTRLPLNIV